MPRLQSKERILKGAREKYQFTYKCKLMRSTLYVSEESLRTRKAWNDTFQSLTVNMCQTRLLYPAK
jgi:hypothetical protein